MRRGWILPQYLNGTQVDPGAAKVYVLQEMLGLWRNGYSIMLFERTELDSSGKPEL